MKYYWVSWYSKEGDYRPLTYPPNKQILGWWVSGEGSDGISLVALVAAENVHDANQALIKEWPECELNVWRFFHSLKEGEKLSNRWQLSDWMKDRINPTLLSN